MPSRRLPPLLFAVRLACRYGWEAAYTGRVITEYRKFLFLCCASLYDVKLSNAVSQVWQLHLTYTKSYWHDLCRDTIGGELHHYPAQAGKVLSMKLCGNGHPTPWSMSKTPYEDYFGAPPPADIWPDDQYRKLDAYWQRVDRCQYWVIPKPTTRQWDFLWTMLFFVLSYWVWNLTGGWQLELRIVAELS